MVDTSSIWIGVGPAHNHALEAGCLLAQGAEGVVFTDMENALLSSVEARLADEVRSLVLSLNEFARAAQLVGEEIPVRAQFCKHVTTFLGLFALQFSHALGKGMDERIFADDGAVYLKKLVLQMDDLFREINLDGRRFMAVALIDESTGQVFDGAKR